MRKTISPRDLAKAIGVSESSLKRWADSGRLNVHRTAGGHRRIPMAEALRFVRTTQTPILEPDVLGLPQLSALSGEMPARGDEATRLFQMLRAGESIGARGLMLALYLSGRSAAEIFDGPMRSALTHLGELWRHEPEGVFIEHRASDICVQSLSELRSLIEVPDHAPMAVGAAPQGDPYLLPSMMAAITLMDNGWRTVNLGPDTPIDSLEQAARQHQPDLVWISISSHTIAESVLEQISNLPRRLSSINAGRGTRIVIGGGASEHMTRKAPHGLHFGSSMQALADHAQALQSFTRGHLDRLPNQVD